MPSPPRRATRSAVPVAGAAPAPSSRTQKTASLSASSSSSSSSVTGKLPRSAPKSKSSSPVVTQNEHAQDDSLLDAGSRRSQRTRKASEADTLGVLAAEDEPNPDQNVAQDDSEDVTRCLCGGSLYTDDGDDPMYIQCDTCLVWQHGGCVGIYDDSQAPETYFCELCRPDLHRLSVRSNGYVFRALDFCPHQRLTFMPSPVSPTLYSNQPRTSHNPHLRGRPRFPPRTNPQTRSGNSLLA